MDTARICPSCHKLLPADAPQGLCQQCLLQAALATGTEIGGASPKFVPPSVQDLAAKFPQLEILEFIGQGGMGAVYKARQKQLDRIVALKILPPQAAGGPGFAERFAREARALAKLNHPHIVTLYEFGQADGLFYFLMEFVDGINLHKLLGAGPIAPKEALAIVPQICEALQFAHESGIVHRDIKPENILLDKRGQVKIADFGVAKIVAEGMTEAAGTAAAPAGELTEAGSTLGTPQYMAPEQIKNSAEVDHRADIYSLGVVFYQMLTGELPSGKIEAPSKKVLVDVRLDEIVLRALEAKPELRYQQVSDVKTMVETIAQTRQPGEPSQGDQSAKKKRLSLAAASVIAAAIGVVSLIMAVFINDKINAEGPGISQLLKNGAASDSAQWPVIHGWSNLIHLNRYVFKPLACAGILGGLILGWLAFWQSRKRTEAEKNHLRKAAAREGVETEPRFSQTAIVGAFWAPVFFIMLVLTLWVHLAGWAGIILMFTLVPLGVIAPFRTTILGWIAVTQIRHSAGKLYGLGLAVFDGLCFPLLALDGLVGITWWAVMHLLVPAPRFGATDHTTILFWALITLATAAVVDIVIIWRVWRAVTAPVARAGAGPLATPPEEPRRRFHWGWAIALIVVMGLMVAAMIASLFVPRVGNSSPAVLPGVAESPFKLKTLPTDQVIQAGLTKPEFPWAWQELQDRAKNGRFSAAESEKLMVGLTAWARNYPEGFSQPLNWLDNLLDDLYQRNLLTETNEIAFLVALHGNPHCNPLPRVREGERSLMLTCHLSSPWNTESFGFRMLNRVISIRIDGHQVVPSDSTNRQSSNRRQFDSFNHQPWNSWQFTEQLVLPSLAPGAHVIECSVESAFVSKSDVAGLNDTAPPEDWPPARLRWTRSCRATLMVYARDAVLVNLSGNPALNPVANGALSVTRIIIRPKSNKLTAVAVFELKPKPTLPVSVNATLQIAGAAILCGKLTGWVNPNGSVTTSSSGEGGAVLQCDLDSLAPDVREADVMLDPAPGDIEKTASVDKIWSGKIVIPHVPLTREDLSAHTQSGEILDSQINEAGTASDRVAQLVQQGWQLWQERQLDAAAEKFQQATQMDPENTNAWNGLGWAKENAGKFPEAETAFRRALALDPNYAASLNGLGQIYLAERKYDDAENYLLKASPAASAAWYGLARLYLLRGNFADAEKWAQKVVDSGQGDETANQMLKAAKNKRLTDSLRLLIEPPETTIELESPAAKSGSQSTGQ